MALSKLSTALVGMGTVGVGGVGIAGWNMLSSGGASDYVSNDIVLQENQTGISFSNHNCFKKYFDGVEVGQDSSETFSGPLISPTKNTDEEDTPSNPEGCVVMKMSHDVEKLKWTISGELILKGNDISWVIWFEGFGKLGSDATNVTDYYQDLVYQLIFLEKGEEDKWEVKTGYSWKDGGIASSPGSPEIKINVSVVGKSWANFKKDEDYIQSIIDSGTTGTDKSENRGYSGIWKYTNDDNDKGVLQEIIVAGEAGKEEILGKDGNFSVNLDEDSKVYDPKNKKWKDYTGSGGSDLPANLNEWYKPFKGKKGSWQ